MIVSQRLFNNARKAVAYLEEECSMTFGESVVAVYAVACPLLKDTDADLLKHEREEVVKLLDMTTQDIIEADTADHIFQCGKLEGGV